MGTGVSVAVGVAVGVGAGVTASVAVAVAVVAEVVAVGVAAGAIGSGSPGEEASSSRKNSAATNPSTRASPAGRNVRIEGRSRIRPL